MNLFIIGKLFCFFFFIKLFSPLPIIWVDWFWLRIIALSDWLSRTITNSNFLIAFYCSIDYEIQLRHQSILGCFSFFFYIFLVRKSLFWCLLYLNLFWNPFLNLFLLLNLIDIFPLSFIFDDFWCLPIGQFFLSLLFKSVWKLLNLDYFKIRYFLVSFLLSGIVSLVLKYVQLLIIVIINHLFISPMALYFSKSF